MPKITARKWLKENAKVGWIAEKLNLPIIEAVIPVMERYRADIIKQCADHAQIFIIAKGDPCYDGKDVADYILTNAAPQAELPGDGPRKPTGGKTGDQPQGSSIRSGSTPAVAALADKIIAAYKEHYRFPNHPQGEAHMHDCIMDAARCVSCDEPIGNDDGALCEYLNCPLRRA